MIAVSSGRVMLDTRHLIGARHSGLLTFPGCVAYEQNRFRLHAGCAALFVALASVLGTSDGDSVVGCVDLEATRWPLTAVRLQERL